MYIYIYYCNYNLPEVVGVPSKVDLAQTVLL